MAPLAKTASAATAMVAGQVRPTARPSARVVALQPKRVVAATRRAQVVAQAAAEEVSAEEVAATPASDEKKTLADFEVGQILEGKVAGIQSYGAFIDIGATSAGLVHISQLKKDFVDDVSAVVSEGQAVQVKVMSIDEGKGRIALTMILEDAEPKKQRRGGKREPAEPIEYPFAAGDEVKGTIKRVAGFGVFVEVAEGIEGLLHSSEMLVEDSAEDDGFDTANVRNLFKEGDEITGLFIKEIADGKVSLTEKSDDQNAWEAQLATKGAVAGLGSVKKSMSSAFAIAGLSRDSFPDISTAPAEPAEAAPAPVEEPAAAAAPAPAEEAPPAPAPAGGISAKDVKALREASGAGMMDCKKALQENGGDIEAAKDWLRAKGLASAGKKAGRVAAEGAVVQYIHAGARLGVLMEVNCETDFVARGDVFQELASDMAMQVAACPDVVCISADDVPSDLVEAERAIEMEKEDIKSKPENIRPQIVEGRIAKFKNSRALLAQDYIKDTTKTVEEHIKAVIAATGENVQIRRFTRFNLGEGLQKKEEDFAAEVAAQTQKKEEEAPKAEAPKEDAPKEEEAKPVVKVDAKLVKQLRESSGAGMMDCKKALAENGNDLAAAEAFLKKKGLASADKKASRIAAEGGVFAYIHAGARLGVLVEVNCETDFVARGDIFKQLCADMAMQVAACPEVVAVKVEDIDQAMLDAERKAEMEKEDLASKPENIRAQIVEGRVAKIANTMALLEQDYIKDTSKTVGDVLKESVASIGENIQIRRFERFNLGEGIEKKVDNLADEVAKMTA